jgi:hypothetical protein
MKKGKKKQDGPERIKVKGSSTNKKVPIEKSTDGSNKRRKIKGLILHPFLIGIYPVLYLLGHNIHDMLIMDSLRSFAVAILFSALLYGIGILIFRDRFKTALVVSLALLLFYTYGRVHTLLMPVKIFGSSLGNLRYLGLFYLVLLALGIWLILKKLQNRKVLNDALNFISIILVIIPIVQISIFEIQKNSANSKARQQASQVYASTGTLNYKPDIYYIILDAYTRDDILQEEFGFDNSPFLTQLENLGFYVARCSMANYGHTTLSMTSAFEMDYLQNIYRGYLQFPAWSTTELIRFLRNNGYEIYTLQDEFQLTPSLEADVIIPHSSGSLARSGFFGSINKFEVMLIESSAAVVIENVSHWFPQANIERTRLTNFYYDTYYWLDQSKKLPEKPGPKFVLLHFFVPHDPFIFSPDGKFIDIPSDAKVGYTNSVQFINNQIVSVVRSLLDNSPMPPVIIIQGDHGPSEVPGTTPYQRMANLNVYYLPYNGNASLYPSITPVNSFRLVLNLYFGQHLPLLDDISYYNPEETLESMFNQAQIIEDARPGCPAGTQK